VRLVTRAPKAAAAPTLVRDADIVGAFLEDAAHVPGGHAAGVAFPRDEAEVAALVRAHDHVLPVGALSSLTGGATPRGDVVLSTRAMTHIHVVDERHVEAGAGVAIADLQHALAQRGLYYPPVPTFEGAFVGGTIATNAAGAATHKYGTTRAWVDALTVVLANGDVLDLRRADTRVEEALEIEFTSGEIARLVLPHYEMPHVPKHSAGYYARAGDYDPIDLFIGAEGTLGVIVSATLRVIPKPSVTMMLVACESDARAIAITAALCAAPAVDVAGVEYVDGAALAVLDDDAFGRAGTSRPRAGSVLLFAQFEGSVDAAAQILELHDADTNVVVVMPGDDRGAARLFELREAVPAAVNRRVGLAKAQIDPAIEKTAGDMIVPFDRLADSLALYRTVFDRRGLQHAIWGHFSDGNLHPNVIPRSLAEVDSGKAALLEIGRAVVGMGGSPLAEHGVGRNPVKQALLRNLYGDAGIEEMRAIKRALDPEWKLASGVLFPAGA
jgi:D-lactate dehydrogenase (cytochrome)